ncbi:MAG: hypothetical protein IK024_10595 [Treponema sp.]|nr:hypothetical protein [Treponema sp.]
MEKLINFYQKKIKLILGIITCVCLINCIINIFFKNVKISSSFLGFGLSILFFFLAWGMCFIVLGFQKINPFCPKSIFKFFCFFIIIISTIGIIYGVIQDTILCLLKDNEDVFPFVYSTAPAGFVYGSIFLYRKTFGNDVETEVLKEEITDENKKRKIRKNIIIFGSGFAGAIIVCVFVFSTFLKSEPYLYSIQLIENNQEILNYLGENYKLPKIVSGSISTNGNGTGTASISYKIKGKNGVSRVYVDAIKENGIWNYRKIIFYKEKGKADSIDLLLISE